MANRILLGNHSTHGHGLYISKPGKNAVSDDKINLIFNSESPHGHGSISQIIDITASSSSPFDGTGTITDLGYIPFVHISEIVSGGGVKGIRSYWSRSAGGGSGPGQGGGMGGGSGGGGPAGRSQLKRSEWRATVTRTQIKIVPWLYKRLYSTAGNINHYDDPHGEASHSYPGTLGSGTSGKTFKCIVYKIKAGA